MRTYSLLKMISAMAAWVDLPPGSPLAREPDSLFPTIIYRLSTATPVTDIGLKPSSKPFYPIG